MNALREVEYVTATTYTIVLADSALRRKAVASTSTPSASTQRRMTATRSSIVLKIVLSLMPTTVKTLESQQSERLLVVESVR